MEKQIIYPAEITFKSIFRSNGDTVDSINGILRESDIEGTVTRRESDKGTFISYTITATFQSDEMLVSVCDRIATLKGFMSMF